MKFLLRSAIFCSLMVITIKALPSKQDESESVETFKSKMEATITEMPDQQQLGARKVHEDWSEKALKLEQKLAQLETTIKEIGVVRFMKVNFGKFIESRCNSIKKVRKSVKEFKPPLDDELPPEIIKEWKKAKGTHREVNVEKFIVTFKYTYQQVRAILKKTNSTDPALKAFRELFNTKGSSAEDADHKIAMACAYLNRQLSADIYRDDYSKKISWKDEEATIEALKECGILDPDPLKVARVLFHLRLNNIV